MALAKPAPKPPATPPKPAGAAKPGATPANEDAPPPPPKRGKKLLVLVVVLVLLLLAGGGGAAWYFLAGPGAAHPPAAAAGKEAKGGEHDKSAKPPVFVNLEQFTVNLAPESGDRYLQASIVLQLDDDHGADAIKTYMPVLRNRIIMLLSSKKPSELETVVGKQKLVDELVAATRESLPGTSPTRGISGALLSSFVIQ